MKNINELMDKYWNADTNPEEEKMIRDYFASDKVSKEHIEYVNYFRYLQNEKAVDREFNPLAKVEELMKNENVKAVDNEKMPKTAKIISFSRRWQAVAAMMVFSLLCMWGVSLYLNQAKHSEVVAKPVKKARIIEINDPEEAMQYTEDAMNLIASMLKTGTEPVTEGLDKINQTPVIGDLQ